ncbi:ABC transporter permease [Hephaestia sp. GCM10023244]|nr:ABC transporter permease [Hephaestia sp. MAHUQ-44]
MVRRTLVAVPILLVIASMTFAMLHAAPGSPFTGAKVSPAVEAQTRARFALDRPLPEQFVRYLGNAVTGDFGPSLKYPGRTVGGIIAEGLPTSAIIGGLALLFGTAFGVTLGIGAALRRGGAIDRIVGTVILGGIAVPTFVMGPILIFVFSSRLKLLPNGGLVGASAYVLPVVVLTIPLIAAIARIVRTEMIASLRSNAVRSARGRGLSRRRVVLGYALPPALMPLISFLAPAAAGLMTGSFVVELIFGIPGLGRAFVLGALQRDYSLVMGVILLYATLIVIMNLIADIAYAAIDPRVRL